jgi:hypothetical protein
MRRRALCLSVNELSDRYGIEEKSLRELEPLRLTAKTLGTSASGQPCGSAAALRTAAIVKGFRMPARHRREGVHGGRRPKSLEGGNRGGVRDGGGVDLWGFGAGA